MKVLKMLIWIPLSLIIIYLAILLYIYFAQDKMIFYPTDDMILTPAELGLAYEDVELNLSDAVNLHGWYIFPEKRSEQKVVLFCHGNAGNISHRLETAQYLTGLGLAVMLFDYRGYGKSTGAPSEAGVYTDAESFYLWLVEEKKYHPENIFIFGRSLGGAVSVELATRVKSGGVIVESSFTTVGDMGQKLFPIFPVKKLIRYKFDSLAKIKNLTCPVLVTHSPDDDLVPYFMGEKLYQEASEPKEFVKISGGHNSRSYFDQEDYKTALKTIFKL